MTRHAYVHAFDAHEPNPLDRACEEPGRARRRNDLPATTFLGDAVAAECGDAEFVRTTGGIVRPDRRVVRNGTFGRLWIFDHVAAGC